MRNFIKMISVAVLGLALVACNDEPKFDNDYTKTESAFVSSKVNEARGAVLHKGVYATSIKAKASKLAEGMFSYGIVISAQGQDKTMLALTCVRDLGVSAVAHTILTNDGEPVTGESTISIMKYRKGIMNIQELDENSTPVFSLANGDTDLAGALTKLKDIDPEATLAFTIETMQDDGYSYTVAWSPLMKAGDLAKAVAKLPLSHCADLPLAQDDPEVVLGYTNAQLIAGAQQ